MNNKGITLLEIIVAVGIFALIAGAIVQVFLVSWRNNAIVWEQLATQNEGRKVIQDFSKELREASDSSIGSYAIESASGTQIVFFSNIDSDAYKERIRYFVSSTILKKGIIKPSGSPLAYSSSTETVIDVAHDMANGTSSVFFYYDKNFTGSQTPLSSPIDVASIRVVRIILKLEEDPNLSPTPFYIESKVMIRNLKDN
ncbi:MAG: prepilin-type N-terminal cleavage/methylation domain-containing protein [Patescibacteria group bacterium]